MGVRKVISGFFKSEKSGGLILVLVTLVSLIFSNSGFGESYIGFWEQHFGIHTFTDWINDGLMAVFFLLIGLELKREIFIGELSEIKKASLPVFAAFGGMLIPAGIFLLLNFGTSTQAGAGIPMATDIAFAIGILSLLGKRVPLSLKVFLTALAVIDDLGAIVVIAVFYSKGISFVNLGAAMGIYGVLLLLNKYKIASLPLYLFGGVIMWYFMMGSGIHATITGVLLAFAIPFGSGKKGSISSKLEHFLHVPVIFVILPLFALANTCIPIATDWQDGLEHSNSLGIIAGLALGKPIGIVLFAAVGVASGMCNLPKGLRWKHIIGTGFLGGIGFTMSIFITLLAFDETAVINASKIAVLVGSTLAGIAGYSSLRITLKDSKQD